MPTRHVHVHAVVHVLVLVLGLGLGFGAAGCQRGEAPPAAATILDLNHATVRDLERLPALGPRRARSIIASRSARGGRFERLEDLLQIDGIGPKTLDAIRPYVAIGK
jgi:competence ComEA-like helix-hairpin-helix protein